METSAGLWSEGDALVRAALALLALAETVALAVHLEDMEWWASRSRSVPVRRSEPNAEVHSWKGNLLIRSLAINSPSGHPEVPLASTPRPP